MSARLKMLTFFRDRLGNHWSRLLFLAFAIFVSSLAFVSPVTYASADPHFSLIVSQSVLDHGSLRLDAYRAEAPELFESFAYQINEQNGHSYYSYPSGPSFLALPLVALARLAGKDMLVVTENHQLQNLISALLCGLIPLLLYQAGRAYLSPLPALVVVVVFTLGSGLISTLATALWNQAFAVLFISAGLWLLADYDSGRRATVRPIWLALCLFAAYLSRPSAAFFILIIFAYLFFKDKRQLWQTAVPAGLLLLLFLIFSRLEYGQWLPFYYAAGSWFDSANIWRPLYGVLFSPSRGLFIYTPFLLVVVVGIFFAWRPLRPARLFWLAALAVGLQIIAVATTRLWWGGFSFGPRLLVDALPLLALMTFILWRHLRLLPNQSWFAAAFLALALPAVFINSMQGLFNVKTPLWNAFPNVDEYPDYLFDWHSPQFLVTIDAFHARYQAHVEEAWSAGRLALTPYQWGQTLSPASPQEEAYFFGWWPAGAGEWWTETDEATILFAGAGLDTESDYRLTLTASAREDQPVTLLLNGSEIGRFLVEPAGSEQQLVFNGRLFHPDDLNRLTFQLPQAAFPPPTAWSQLGLKYAPHRLGLTNLMLRIEPAP